MRSWQTRMSEWTEQDREREQGDLQGDKEYKAHSDRIKAVSATGASPQRTDIKTGGKLAADTAASHARAETRGKELGASPQMLQWHAAKRRRAEFQGRQAGLAARTQASFNRPVQRGR